MKRIKHVSLQFVLIKTVILLFFIPAFSFSETNPLPVNESPETFLELDRDSENVDFFLSGSWKINLTGSTGAGWSSSDGIDTDLYYPGISPGIAFSQSPDFTALILLQQQYLFEAAFTSDFNDSTFRLGYIGLEDEILQSLSAGNMGINLGKDVESSEYFYIPGGGSSSFGIFSRLAGPSSSHELLFRFDPASDVKKVYIGSDSVSEITLSIDEYIRGTYFLIGTLPAAPEFYRETESSSSSAYEFNGRYYLRLEPEDFSYSPSSGFLMLTEQADGAVLMRSEGASTLIYDPGIDSDFELKSLYDLAASIPEEKWKTRCYLAESPDNLPSAAEINFDILDHSGLVKLGNEIFDSDTYNAGAYGGKQLVFIIREETTGYTVDNAVEGSIRIYINGLETTAWEETDGVISFNSPPGINDRIEINYRQNSGTGGSGDLLFASANRFMFTDHITSHLNGGIRWSLADGYARIGEETSSYGGLSAGFSFEKPGISFRLEGGLKIWTPNSAGNLLLKSMSGDDYVIAVNRKNIFPGSISSNLQAEAGINISGRGELIYREYRIPAGISDFVLLEYDADIDSSMIFRPSDSTAADRYPAGPYTASAESDGISGEVLVMDYDLAGPDSWASVQIPVSSGSRNIDLSKSKAVSFLMKYDGTVDDIEILMEAGSLSEDLDGDGRLDAETGILSEGFVFNDPNTEAGTLVGGDRLKGNNALLDSEDFNGSGFADAEKPDAVVAAATDSSLPFYSAAFSRPESEWKRVRIFLDKSIDSLDPGRLSNCEFIRFSVINKSTGQRTGRILFNDIRFESAGMTAVDNASFQPPRYSEISESLIPSGEQPSAAIESPTLRGSETNSMLRVEWDSDWQLYSWFSPLAADQYSKSVFHFYCPEIVPAGSDSPSLTFALTDADGNGRTASIPVSSGGSWQKVEITDNSVFVNGSEAAGAVLSGNLQSGNINKITLGITGASSGIVYIDEIYLTDPSLTKNAGVSAVLDLSSDKAILKAGEFEIIGPGSFSNSASLNDEGFDYSTAVSTTITGIDTDVELALQHTESSDLISASHALEIPLIGDFLSLSDIFSADSVSGGDFYKDNGLSLITALVSGRLAGFSSLYSGGQLTRNWTSAIDVNTEKIKISADADFLLTDYPSEPAWYDYFAGWWYSTALAGNFSSADPEQRRVKYALAPSLDTKPAGFSLKAEFQSDIAADAKVSETAEAEISVPFVFETDGNQVKTGLTLTRTGVFVSDSRSDNFLTDTSEMFNTFRQQELLYKSVPVYELFAPDLPAEFFDSCSGAGIDAAKLINSARIDFSRSYSSRISDLLLPYSFELGFERLTEKDYLDLEDTLSFDYLVRTAAINLFGRAGAYSFFDFYFSDELNWSVEAEYSDLLSSSITQKYTVNTGLSVFGHNDEIFSSDLSFYIPVNTDEESYIKAELIYLWNAFPATPFDIPLITDENSLMQLYTHEEKISFDIENSFSVEFKHTTSFIIPQRLTLSAFALTGLQFLSADDNKSILGGISIGISGSLMY